MVDDRSTQTECYGGLKWLHGCSEYLVQNEGEKQCLFLSIFKAQDMLLVLWQLFAYSTYSILALIDHVSPPRDMIPIHTSNPC